MDAVIKVGGSLAEDPATLKQCCNKLSEIAKEHEVTVVPGGARFADVVREFDQRYTLFADISHKMAILGMDQFGLFLSQMIPSSCANRLRKAPILSKILVFFLGSTMLISRTPTSTEILSISSSSSTGLDSFCGGWSGCCLPVPAGSRAGWSSLSTTWTAACPTRRSRC